MDRTTVEIYERQAGEWLERRQPGQREEARAFGRDVGGGVRADLGCGPGWYADALGSPVVALDAARSMLDLVPEYAPSALRVRGDLEHLPFRTASLVGGWACASYVHVPARRLPMALADLFRSVRLGGLIDLRLFGGDHEGPGLPNDDFPGRFFTLWPKQRLADVVTGAGFVILDWQDRDRPKGEVLYRIRAERALALADTVGGGMRMLVCGLNPSVYSAEAGISFARPGNRFWPAALAAGIVSRDRDPDHALLHHGIGMTNLVIRPTVAAAELTTDEYCRGMERLDRLVAWLQPGVVCFVGLAGWRAVVDRKAATGLQDEPLGGRPVYLMPSTSGLNAHSQVDDLTNNLRRAAALT
ncbi:MAG: uracil-DNA glycosylase family protein [Actinomycetota bacterium]